MKKKKKLKIDDFPAVLLEWTDSISDNAAWRDFNDAIEWAVKPLHISSLGWLVEITDTHYLVASAYSELTGQLGGLWRMPKGCVTKVTYL